ncbi:MAG: hypothetical protein FJY99_07860 [Candidatus Sericytochromatia bacterium]|nr:hypothetical protein [Candidatus Tanganyikabacteria bacterium]
MSALESTLLPAIAVALLAAGELATTWGVATPARRSGCRLAAAAALACGLLDGAMQAAALALLAVAGSVRGAGLASPVGLLGMVAATSLTLSSQGGGSARGWAGMAFLVIAGSLVRLQDGRRTRTVLMAIALPIAALAGAQIEPGDLRTPLLLLVSAAAGWLTALSGLPKAMTGMLALGSWALAGPWGGLWCLAAWQATTSETDEEDATAELALALLLAGPVAELTGFWTVGPDPGQPHLLLAMAAGLLQAGLGLCNRAWSGIATATGLLLGVAGSSGAVWVGGWLTGTLLARAARPSLANSHPASRAAHLVFAVSLPYLPALPSPLSLPLTLVAVAALLGLVTWQASKDPTSVAGGAPARAGAPD